MLLSQVNRGFEETSRQKLYFSGVYSEGVTDAPGLVKVDFQQLTAFERVSDRYEHLGVRFSEAIALEPSNPTFGTGYLVLMPVANRKSITAHFNHPVRKLEARVSAASPVTLTAFDRHGNPLCLVSCTCKSEDEQILPRQRLELEIEGIAKVMFYCEAPFVLEELRCDVLSSQIRAAQTLRVSCRVAKQRL